MPPTSRVHTCAPSRSRSATTLLPTVGTNTRPRAIAGVPCTVDCSAACQTSCPSSARSARMLPSRSAVTTKPSATTGLASTRPPPRTSQRPSVNRAPERSAENRACPASSPGAGQSSARAVPEATTSSAPTSSSDSVDDRFTTSFASVYADSRSSWFRACVARSFMSSLRRRRIGYRVDEIDPTVLRRRICRRHHVALHVRVVADA